MLNGTSGQIDPKELGRHISAWCDGVISDQDFAKLQATLSEDSNARDTYTAYMNVQAGIRGEVAAIDYLTAVAAGNCGMPQNSRVSAPAQRRWQKSLSLLMATAALILVALVIGTNSKMVNSLVGNVADDELVVATKPLPVARILDASSDCQWSLDQDGVHRTVVCVGDMIRVVNGVLKIAYNNGTELSLHGPALFEVISVNSGRELFGKLTAKITEGGEGFSVLTPRATVIDLGTEFGVEVDGSGATDIVVFDGLVDLAFNSSKDGVNGQQRLSTGEAMHLDAFGTISRLVSITNQRFADQPPGHSTTRLESIISSVRDNIQRKEGWNYYEVVHGGMREDAKAFVDRIAHEWNGLEEGGMPPYLVGGDYVKMFNNDKCRKDIEIIVGLAMPCRLYVLFDDRIQPPSWLREDFQYTGDKIGVDDGPWVHKGAMSENVFSGVGPGVSVDDSMSVWVREVRTPGPITLGATETPLYDLNMYGIVAVPMEGVAEHKDVGGQPL